VLIVLKSGSLNLLETSGPVKACNGIALPFAILGELTVFVHGYRKADTVILRSVTKVY
jgi:hypothetical protein